MLGLEIGARSRLWTRQPFSFFLQGFQAREDFQNLKVQRAKNRRQVNGAERAERGLSLDGFFNELVNVVHGSQGKAEQSLDDKLQTRHTVFLDYVVSAALHGLGQGLVVNAAAHVNERRCRREQFGDVECVEVFEARNRYVRQDQIKVDALQKEFVVFEVVHPNNPRHFGQVNPRQVNVLRIVFQNQNVTLAVCLRGWQGRFPRPPTSRSNVANVITH